MIHGYYQYANAIFALATVRLQSAGGDCRGRNLQAAVTEGAAIDERCFAICANLRQRGR
jgi:hypothetical protein